jgi:endoglucanase
MEYAGATPGHAARGLDVGLSKPAETPSSLTLSGVRGDGASPTFVRFSVGLVELLHNVAEMASMRSAMHSPRLLVAAAVLALCACALLAHGASASGHARAARERAARASKLHCSDPYPAKRDPSNPLDLPTPPGANPLTGAQFMDPGPGRGNYAATAIAHLMGMHVKKSSTESWASFEQRLQTGRPQAKLAANHALARKVDELALIAGQPQAQRISTYSWGGTPRGIYKQTHKVFCDIEASDPGAIPLITTYFLHPNLHGCPTTAQIHGYMPRFKRQINAMAKATGRHPAVYMLELDAIGSSSCISRQGAMPAWEAALRYEMHAVQSLPHTVVYVEGGYSDSNSARYAARILRAIHVNTIRGFFTNDTHNQWTLNEVKYGNEISRMTHGAHYIVNTSDNGRGPKLNPHPSRQGVEDLCNPPGRGLGIEDTTDTGYAQADGFLWVHSPGMSSGTCNGGPKGGFWPAKAEAEAGRANDRLGPETANRPYYAPRL